jgi:hypothetical protein
MTHAETQDLLVDLAFGELDPPRAAEVEEHLAGCAECRKEKAALDEARRLSAPLRELEEPPPGFDERILAAARAEAHHQHDGNVGQVIEVTGDVRPLGVEAARIDAHAPVRARPAERRRPKWMVRVALGGSVAAAAALALVVSTTLDARRTAQRVSEAQREDYKIRVKPATPEAVDSALRDAENNRERDRAGATQGKETVVGGQVQAPPAAAEEKQDRIARPPPARQLAVDRGARMEGSGGDAAESRVRRKDAPAPGPAAAAPASPTVQVSSGGKVSGNGKAAPAAPVAMPETRAKKAANAGAPASVAAQPQAGSEPEAVKTPAPQEAPAGLAKGESYAKTAAAAPARDPAEIEARAQQARHAGNYVLAASLYRSAADLRRREEDAPSAAWNLAHAVECLSAVARFEEARQVRDELVRLYPSEKTALSAARRALREVDMPGSPAAK